MAVSRDSYDENKNYFGEQAQEDNPVLDDEETRQNRITEMWVRRTIAELIGNGSPNDGFKLTGVVTNPLINAGNIYVTGFKIELAANVLADAQPDPPVSFPSGDGIWYLRVKRLLYDYNDDAALEHPDFLGIIAVKMVKAYWQVDKELGASLPTPADDEILFELASETSSVLTDTRFKGNIVAGVDTEFQNREGGPFTIGRGMATLVVDGSGNGDYLTIAEAIQALIDDAIDGTIVIKSGTYAGTTKSIDQNIRILGGGVGITHLSSNLIVSTENGKSGVIEDLSSDSLISLNGDGGDPHAERLAILNCHSAGTIQASRAINLLIKGCKVEGDDAKIKAFAQGKNCHVEDNTVITTDVTTGSDFGCLEVVPGNDEMCLVKGNIVRLPSSVTSVDELRGIDVLNTGSRAIVEGNHVQGQSVAGLNKMTGIHCSGSGTVYVLVHGNIIEEFDDEVAYDPVHAETVDVTTRDNIYINCNAESTAGGGTIDAADNRAV